ncbi:MAG TPA: Imm52 family immunity protein, partial [Archangium sp.]
MQEGYYAGAYWGPRQETALECARRAELFFHMLARCDPAFTQWYRAGRGFPRELPGWPVRPEMKELETFFLKGRSRTDVGREVIEDLGFLQMVWNAKK